MENNTNQCKILVLSDLKKPADTLLKNSASLAKIVHGDIHFLCVKKPTEIVKMESQLSAMRTINQEHFATKKHILNLIEPISKAYNIKISHTLSFGNVKDVIGKFIKEHHPDIVVIGKRKSKLLNLMGDKMTQYVYEKHKGSILISAEENALDPNNKLTLGLLNNTNEAFNFSKDLIEHSQKPIKSFKVIKNSNRVQTNKVDNHEKVEYVFEENDNTIKNLSTYLAKNNINLLCVNREKEKKMKTDMSNIVNHLNVSLFFTTDTT